MMWILLTALLLADPTPEGLPEGTTSALTNSEWFEDRPEESASRPKVVTEPVGPSDAEWIDESTDFESMYEQTVAALRTEDATEQRPALLLKARMLASILKSHSLVEAHTAELVEQYPDSFETQYAISTFESPTKLKEFVHNKFFSNLLEKGEAERAVRVTRGLYKLHKYGLLKQPGFAADACLAALIADDQLIWNESRPGVNDAAGKVLDIAADESLPLKDRFHQLETILKNRRNRNRWELLENAQFQLTQKMSPEERNDVSIRRVVAGRLLDTNKLELANGEYSALVKLLNDPELHALYAVCLTRQQRFDEAIAQCKLVQATSPDSPWRIVADAVMSVLETQAEDQLKVIKLISDSVAVYRDIPLGFCDVEVQVELPDSRLYLLNLAGNLVKKEAELTVYRDNELQLGVRTSEAGTYFALGDNQRIGFLRDTYLIPDIELAGARVDETGKVRANCQVSYGTGLGQLPLTWKQLLRNKKLFSQGPLELLLSSCRSSGTFTRVGQTSEGQSTIELTHFCSDEPTVLRSEIVFDQSLKIESARVAYKKVVVRFKRFRVGRWTAQPVGTGRWPASSSGNAVVEEVKGSEIAAIMGQAARVAFRLYEEVLGDELGSISDLDPDENTSDPKSKSQRELDPWFSKPAAKSDEAAGRKEPSSLEDFLPKSSTRP